MSKTNDFFFANINSDGCIDGAAVIRKMATKSKVRNVSAITSTKLRKHLATLSQLFDISNSDLQQLSSFMGHTVSVHLNNYKLPDDVYQTAKISKLLLLSEKGNIAQYKGKKLDDIQISLEEEPIEDDSDIADEVDNIDDLNINEAGASNNERHSPTKKKS